MLLRLFLYDDKVLTQMFPAETDVPDMKKVCGKVDSLLKNPDFADELSKVKLDSDFSNRIEKLCKEGPELKMKPKPTKPTLG